MDIIVESFGIERLILNAIKIKTTIIDGFI
jgi:hypothetical protein